MSWGWDTVQCAAVVVVQQTTSFMNVTSVNGFTHVGPCIESLSECIANSNYTNPELTV